MLVAQRAQALHEGGGRHVEAAFALHRLDDDRRHLRGLDVVLEDAFHRGDGRVDAHAVQRVRELRMEDAAREGPEAQLVGRDLAGQAEREHRASVVAAGEGDDAGALGVGARDFHRVLQRLGATGQQQRFLGEVARCQRVQPLGQCHVGFVGQHLETGVGVEIQLRLDRGDHIRVAVARVEHGNAAGKIDITLAFDVPDLGIVGTGGKDLVGVADAAGHRGVAPRHQRGIGLRGQVGVSIAMHGVNLKFQSGIVPQPRCCGAGKGPALESGLFNQNALTHEYPDGGPV